MAEDEIARLWTELKLNSQEKKELASKHELTERSLDDSEQNVASL